VISATIFWPLPQRLFRFGPLHMDDLAVTLGAAVTVALLLEASVARIAAFLIQRNSVRARLT